MGHTRLGELPKSRKWKAVVASVVGSSGSGAGGAIGAAIEDDIERIAATTRDAANVGLEKGIRDPGLRYTFYLLTQIVLAAKATDWQERLAHVGIRLSPDSSLFDLTSQMQTAIDEHLRSGRRATDISEIAQWAAGEALVVEYPFMTWSVVKTKPDFSAECMRLWIELKYIRQQRDVRQITEDIAADITKYGDNQRRVLFVIYDPSHLVLSEDDFCRPVQVHENMLVRFVR